VVGRPGLGAEDVIGKTVRYLDQRTATTPYVRKALRYVFPDHWSFLLGEIALYSFVVLVLTGIYLTFFFVPSTSEVVYHGPYAPLQGQHLSEAYVSVVDISTRVKAGLLIRQTHHWAANVFIAAIVLHLFRVFFTGAYRKPRELTYVIGVTMLALALFEAYLGYSLVDDLLSGMGLAIGYAVGLSIPVVGGNLMSLLFDGRFPGGDALWPRMYITHVLLLPLLIGGLLALHLALVAFRHHTQFRRSGTGTEQRVVGLRMWPSYVPRTLGLAFATAGVLVLLGGLVQINPIWLWGPYHVYEGTNGAQPDWYLGWLIGGLRLMPGFDVVIGGYTLVPNPFWGGVLFPGLVFGFLYLWPWIERRLTGDRMFHNLLERPRDAPLRTAVGAGMVSWVFLVFVAGSADRVSTLLWISYPAQIWFYRVLALIVPPLVGLVAYRVCRELQAGEAVEERRQRAEKAAEAAAAGLGGETAAGD
jgi:quinol---cytochrome-c reductase cytochrome b subunit